jgi:hypothetical protein
VQPTHDTKPTMDNLLTFGCRVTAKLVRDQTSPSAEPQLHQGVFLGHQPNNDIRCWDVSMQLEKTVGHREHHKLQHGDDPA